MNEQFGQLYIRDNNSNNSRNMPDLYSGYATTQRQAVYRSAIVSRQDQDAALRSFTSASNPSASTTFKRQK